MNRLHDNVFAPWAALLASFLATGLHQQFLGDVLRFDCRAGTPTTGLLAGLVSLVLVALGCWVSLAATQGRPFLRTIDATRWFIARLGLMFAVLAAVVIAWQVLATFLVAACPD